MHRNNSIENRPSGVLAKSLLNPADIKRRDGTDSRIGIKESAFFHIASWAGLKVGRGVPVSTAKGTDCASCNKRNIACFARVAFEVDSEGRTKRETSSEVDNDAEVRRFRRAEVDAAKSRASY